MKTPLNTWISVNHAMPGEYDMQKYQLLASWESAIGGHIFVKAITLAMLQAESKCYSHWMLLSKPNK